MKTDIQIQNEKLHSDMLTYHAQRNEASAEAQRYLRDLGKAQKVIYNAIICNPSHGLDAETYNDILKLHCELLKANNFN
jgi:hypothetical protein